MNINKSIHDLEASLAVMRDNIELFHRGRVHSYRVLASELRKLLCDGRKRSDSLLPRIFDTTRFHPLIGYISKEQDEEYKKRFGASQLDGLVLQIPMQISFDDTGKPSVDRLFNLAAVPLELEEWLQQPLLNERITIRELIRSVADKESAHSDMDYNDTLRVAKMVRIVDEDVHLKIIVAIAEYILSVAFPALEQLKE